MTEQNNTTNSLAHTKWNYKYHIVFAPKYRRKVFYAEKREDIREIIRTLCQWKGVEIIEGEVYCQESHSLQIVQSHGLHIEPNPAWGHCPGDSTF